MNEGDAAEWKEQMIDKATADAIAKETELDLGTYKDFEKSLNDMFAPYDAPGDALEKMKELRMKIGESIDDHNAKFKMLVPESLELNQLLLSTSIVKLSPFHSNNES